MDISYRALFSLVSGLLLSPLISNPLFATRAAAQDAPPVIERCTPARGSVNSVLELAGYRLGAEDTAQVKAYFAQGEARLPARTGGTSYVTNDVKGGAQTLEVFVPEGVTLGSWEIVVEVRGQSSAPAAVEIVEWVPPELERVSPSLPQPGEIVSIYGTNFHVGDEIELSDSLGNVYRFESGASAHSVGFTLPTEMPEGTAVVRVGTSKNGVGSFSRPLTFSVTSGPAPLEVWACWMKQVAPGQWAELAVTSLKPLEGAERVEVEFRQEGRLFVVETRKGDSPRVRVPEALAPGAVELRARTWREGLASEWSDAHTFRLLDRLAPPSVEVIEVGAESKPVFLWEGPDRPASFGARPGDALVLRGHFPVATARELRVTLAGPEAQLELPPVDTERGVLIRLPRGIRGRDWRFVISATDGTRSQVPITMRVK